MIEIGAEAASIAKVRSRAVFPTREAVHGGAVHKCHIALPKTRFPCPWHVNCYASMKRPPAYGGDGGDVLEPRRHGGGFLME